MRQARKGLRLQCTTFRVVPDEVLRMQQQGVIKPITLVIWLQLQRFAVEQCRPVRFRELAQYARVSRSTLSAALREMIQYGLITKIEDGEYPLYAVEFSSSGSKIEPRGSKIEPPQVQNAPHGDVKRRIKRRIETCACQSFGDAVSREGLRQLDGSPLSHTYKSSDSFLGSSEVAEIRRQALEAFERRFGFTPVHSSSSDWTYIMLCLSADDSSVESVEALLSRLRRGV